MSTQLKQGRDELAQLFHGIGVEVGVAYGHYSEVIVQNPKVTKLYGIDPFEPHLGYKDYVKQSTFDVLREDAERRMEPFGDRYQLLYEYSMDAIHKFAHNSLDFVYIDADHKFEQVLEDITEWTKRVRPGGIVSGHDYVRRNGPDHVYGVKQAVDKYVAENNKQLFTYRRYRSPSWMFYA